MVRWLLQSCAKNLYILSLRSVKGAIGWKGRVEKDKKTDLRRGLEKYTFLFTCFSLNSFDDFNYGDNADSKSHSDAVINDADGIEAESICKEGNFNNSSCEEE